MSRPPRITGLGTRDLEEFEMRMGALEGMTGEEMERKVFTEALRDGYVLCQFMNKLRLARGSIECIDPHEDGILRTSNVTKFLNSCFAHRLPPEDVFLYDDLIDATPDSLARVARTIIALVKLTEKPLSTHSLLLQSEGNAKFDEGSNILPPYSRVTNGADDSPYLRSLGLSADGAITHTTRDQSISPPTRSCSISSSRRNQSVSPSTINLKGSPSMKNQPIYSFSKNQTISLSTKNMPPATNMSTSPSPNPSPNLSRQVSISTIISPSTNMSTSPLPNPLPNLSPLASISANIPLSPNMSTYPLPNLSRQASISAIIFPSTNISTSPLPNPLPNLSPRASMNMSTNMSTSPLPNPSPNLSPLVSISASPKNMPIQLSPKNQNMSLQPSTGNRSIAPSRMKQFVTPSNINVSAAHHERGIFRLALDRCAAPHDLAPWGAIGDGAEPPCVVVGEDVKPCTQVYVGDCIGRGSWGPVYHSLNLTTVQTVAVKLVRLVRLKERHITQMMEEIDLVKRLSHPSIVKYEGMAQDEHTLRIVLEYAENDSLKEKLELSGKINETLVADYVVRILEGLDFLHRNGIVHGNLKAANIFTTNVGNVKLSDFGLSLNRLALGGEIRNIPCAPNWSAPEIIEQTGSSTKSDIWSLGCTVIELLTGQPPYGDIPNIQSVRFRITMDDYPPIPEDFSRPLTSFLEECFQRVPAHRPSVEELFEHEWLKHAMNKDMQTPDTNSIPDDVKSEQSKDDTWQVLTMVPDLVDTSISKSVPVRPPRMTWHRISQAFSPLPARRPRISETQHAKPAPHSVGGHSFVDATFRKPVICRGCMESMTKAAALCSRCCIVAHSKCMARVPAGCNTLRKYLM